MLVELGLHTLRLRSQWSLTLQVALTLLFDGGPPRWHDRRRKSRAVPWLAEAFRGPAFQRQIFDRRQSSAAL